MVLSQLKRLKEDLEKTQHYIRRLEKDDDHENIPFYQAKLKRLIDAVGKLESMISK